MANEVNTGLAPDLAAEAARTVRTFNPAELLSQPRGTNPLPYAVGPGADVLPTFDPAANLGAAARRGPAMIGDGKPLMARIGGVEVVTIPLEHYAALLSPLQLARPGVVEGGGTPDADGMLLFLLSLHAEGTVSIDQLAHATGLDHVDLGDRIAGYVAAQPQPWAGEMGEDGIIHGVTPDGGYSFRLEPLPDAEAAAVEVAPSAEAATIDLPSGVPEALSAPAAEAENYFKGTRDGKKRGGPMDRKGQPDPREPDPNDNPTGSKRGRPLGNPAV